MTNRYCNLLPSAKIKDDFLNIAVGFDLVQAEMDSKLTANRIINGGFSVNQRVVSGTVSLSAGQYGHDRWKAGSSGCSYTFSTSNNTTTITIASGSLLQVIEGINLYNGTYSLSWTGTAQGKIGAGSFGVSGISASVTGGTNLSIEFNTGTLSKVQFIPGDKSPPFQPRIFAEELALCQRYYEKSYDYSISPGAAVSGEGVFVAVTFPSTGTELNAKVSFKVRKRTSPTVRVWDAVGNAGKLSIYNGTTQTNNVSANNVAITETGFRSVITVTSGYYFAFGSFDADAEL